MPWLTRLCGAVAKEREGCLLALGLLLLASGVVVTLAHILGGTP
jgi:hypothetical protein